MKYQAPFGAADPDDGYVDDNPALDIDGSVPTAKAIEHPQREIVKAISDAGLVPDDGDLTQLSAAIKKVIQEALYVLKAGYTTDIHDLGDSGTDPVTIDLAEESLQTLGVTGSFTLNPPATKNGVTAVLAQVDDTGGYTVLTPSFTHIDGAIDTAADAVNLLIVAKINAVSILFVENLA